MFGYHFPVTAVAAAVVEAERSGLPLEASRIVLTPRTDSGKQSSMEVDDLGSQAGQDQAFREVDSSSMSESDSV